MTKSILYPVLAIAFMLLMVDFVPSELISHNHIIPNCECPDFSKHSEHSQTNYFEDEIPYIGLISKSYKSEIPEHFLLFANQNSNSSFYSEIWQPPKNS